MCECFFIIFFLFDEERSWGGGVFFLCGFSPPLIFLAQLLFRAQTCAVDLSQC